MARPIRIEYPGAWYHITCRGNERRSIFADDQDRETFLKILCESLELYKVELHSYVLMSNHFHLVVNTLEANLQKFMQRFNTSYTVYYNLTHKRSGHLYQGRYKAILVEADEYLLELSRYVHLNPVRIKKYSNRSIAEKLEIIKSYGWSSYAGYVYLRKRHAFMSYAMILQMLSGSDNRRGRNAYGQFVLDGIDKDMKKSFWEEVRGQAVIGTESFVDYIYEQFLIDKKVDEREQSGAAQLRGQPATIEEIAAKVAQVFSISDKTELYLRRSSQRQARSVLLELSRRYLTKKMSMAELGRKLGNISGAALIANSKRLEAAMQKNRCFKKLFEMLEKKVISK